MRTFEEKVNYNKKRYKTDNFSAGYVIGVQMYHDYPKYDEKAKRKRGKQSAISTTLRKAKTATGWRKA